MGIIKKRLRLGEILINSGTITHEQFENAISLQKGSGKKIGEIICELGYASEDTIASAISSQLGFEQVSLADIKIPDEIIGLVSGVVLRKHIAIPFQYNKSNPNILRVAMADPMDIVAVDDLSIITGLTIEPVISTTHEIMLSLDKYYGNSEALNAAEKYKKERESLQQIKDTDNDSDKNDVNNSPIVMLVKTIIEQATRQRASDIHIEALENKVRVRYRIDGVLYEKMAYDIGLLPAIIARLKIIGGMDISEKRKPQDGRITIIVDRREYDIRVSVLPTVFGEKAVLRIASKSSITKDKRELGLSDRDLSVFDRIFKCPHGIILVTGPTGSGKSTTLYTALSELNKEDVNIITVEDPVEANIDGVNQVQVNTRAELTFSNALRSILRQDPDIIMIGEIRDTETATIAVQASITGHLVVSTLHTNSAASTVTRLIDMGIESYLIADSVVGVIAQRLVRRLCPDCKQKQKANPAEKAMLGIESNKDIDVYVPQGCPKCNNTGYVGRIGVYEIMEITPEMRRIISAKGDAEMLKKQAVSEGMKTLSMSAVELAINGITSISEVMRISLEK